jgi:hypothetical protein
MSKIDTQEMQVVVKMDYSAYITAVVGLDFYLERVQGLLAQDPDPSDGFWAGRIAEVEKSIEQIKKNWKIA